MATDGLKLLEDLKNQLKGGTKEFEIEFPMSSNAILKAESLAATGRNFFEANKVMENKMAQAAEKEISKDPEKLKDRDGLNHIIEIMAEAAKDLIIQRFESGGGDVSVKGLKPSTVKSKGSSKVGTDSGDLLLQVKKVKPRIKR